MPFVTILARLGRQVAGYVRKQGLDVAPPLQVQLLFRAPLVRETHAGFAREPLGQGALNREAVIARFHGKFLCRLHHLRIHAMAVLELRRLRRPHRSHRLLLMMMLRLGMLGQACVIWCWCASGVAVGQNCRGSVQVHVLAMIRHGSVHATVVVWLDLVDLAFSVLDAP